MKKQHLSENTTTNIKIFKKYLEASCLIEHSWKPLLFVVVVVVGLELGIENKTLTGHTATTRNLKIL